MQLRLCLLALQVLLLGILQCDGAGMCSSMNQDAITAAVKLTSAVDARVANFFPQHSEGGMYTVVNASSGSDNGGATNPDGTYEIVGFPSELTLPDNMCELPACTNSSSRLECHNRCTMTDVGGEQQSWSNSFMMGYSDVVVITMCSPPPVKYYSWDTIITTRRESQSEYPFYPGQNFGDSVSMSDVDTTGERDSLFWRPTVIIASADAQAAGVVRQAYLDEGVGAESILMRPIDSDIVKMWDRSGGKTVQDSNPDILISIMRASIPLGDVAGFAAWAALWWPARFYFASDDVTAPADPVHPLLASRASPDVMNEMEVFGSLVKELGQGIAAAVTAQGYSQVGTELTDMQVPGFYDDWQAILDEKNNNSFIVPIRDATYGIPVVPEGSNILVTPDTYAVVFGVIHSETINTAYSEVTVGVENVLTGAVLQTIAFNEDPKLIGSAHRYLGGDSTAAQRVAAAAGAEFADPSLLYAVDIKAEGGCTDPAYCFEIEDKYAHKKAAVMLLGTRAYTVQTTGLGPDASATVPAQMLIFTKI